MGYSGNIDELSPGIDYGLQAVNPWYWAHASGINLVAGLFRLDQHEFQVRPMSIRPPVKVIKKGTQGTFPLALDTKVPTTTGWETIKTLKIGDFVFGLDGNPYPVSYKSPIVSNNPCFKIIFDDDTEIIADKDHRWSVKVVKSKISRVKTTQQLRETILKKNGGRTKHAIKICDPVRYPEKTLPIDPYLLGLWLGDGNSYSAQITAHKDDAEIYSRILKDKKIPHEVRFNDKRYANNRNIKLENSGDFLSLGLWQNKHIPDIYLTSSIEQRLELLRGLIDTDGHIDKYGKAKFYNTNHELLDDFQELVSSLGLKPRKRLYGHGKSWDKTYSTKDLYVIQFRIDKRFQIACLPRKNERQKEVKRISEISYRFIKAVIPCDPVPCQCITVGSPDNLFLVTRSFIPTHNTEGEVLNTLHGMIHGYYPTGVYYLFPNKDKVSEFSKSRFKPLIHDNPDTIGCFVRDTDSATLKRIGSGFLYFRSGRLGIDLQGEMKSSAALKGDPADHAVHDEYDEMHPGIDEFVDGRLAKSPIHTKSYLANPTLPDYGIDAKFQASSREYWHIKCQHCRHYTCLDLEEMWPINGTCKALHRQTDGSVIRACQHCGRDLDPRFGEWVAERPAEKEIIGFTIGHPSYAWINAKKLLNDWENPASDKANLIRLRLGRAYIEAENRLSVEEVYACCGSMGISSGETAPCSMGVDQGGSAQDLFHILIGKKHNSKVGQIVHVTIEKGWSELDGLMKRFNIHRCVIDGLPNQDDARKFAARFPGKVFLSYFSESQKGAYKWDEEKWEVSSNRTEAMDASHKEIAERRLVLPARSGMIELYAQHCHHTAKKLMVDEKTGTKRYVYIPKLGGPDHFRLAQCYESMARNGTPGLMFPDF